MTKIFAAIALAALVTTPALAAPKHGHRTATEAMASDASQNGYAQGSGYYAVGPNGAAVGTAAMTSANGYFVLIGMSVRRSASFGA